MRRRRSKFILEESCTMLAHDYSRKRNMHKAYQYLKLSAVKVPDARPKALANKREKIDACLSMLPPLHILGYPEETLEVLHEAERLAQKLGDKKVLATIHSRLFYYFTVKGNPLLGLWYARKCFREQDSIWAAIDSMAEIARNLCSAFWFAGNYEKVADIARKALRIIEKHRRQEDLIAGGVNAYSSLCSWYGSALGWLGKLKRGKAVLGKGLRNARGVNDRFETAFMELMYSTLSYWEGDGKNTVATAQRAVNYFEEAGEEALLGTAFMMLGAGHFLRGEYETAKKHAEKGLSIQTLPMNLSWNYWYLGLIHQAAGNPEAAGGYLEEALELSRECDAKACEGVTRILLGGLAKKADPAHADESQLLLRQGLMILQEQKLQALCAFGYLFTGEFFAGAGRRDAALESLTWAEALYQEMGLTSGHYWMARTRKALAAVYGC
jgi:tetratricopeptide (TPR) repeat protein